MSCADIIEVSVIYTVIALLLRAANSIQVLTQR
jgi:hypothetical protein